MAEALPILTSALVTGAESFTKAQATRTQAKLQERQLRLEEDLLNRRAEDAIARGDRQAAQQAQKTRRTIGQARAAAAGQGIDPETGGAFQLQTEIGTFGAVDEATIRNNALREALGFRLEAGQTRLRRSFTGIRGRSRARSTLLTGGLKFVREVQRETRVRG